MKCSFLPGHPETALFRLSGRGVRPGRHGPEERGRRSVNWISSELEKRVLAEPEELAARKELLESRGLSVPGGEDLILGFFGEDRLVATGSLVGNILEGIAVEKAAEGEGAASMVVTALIKRAVEKGQRRVFIYSRPEEAKRFELLGFTLLATASVPESGLGASLLEWGMDGIAAFRRMLAGVSSGRPDNAGAVVMNCNPFTLGHRHLVEFAASRRPWLYVIVVEEDRSLFPFHVRLRLVRDGTSDLSNVTVIPGGPYVISSATFPTYFTRIQGAEKDERITELHAVLDLELFRNHIAPPLKVSERFVGTEPYCRVTSAYNRMMKTVFSAGNGGLEVWEMPRFELGGVPVSASAVRDCIRQGRLAEAEPFVPESTWTWLNSPEAAPVLQRIRFCHSRH